MHLAYIDDSGNTAAPPQGSLTYSIGCVLIEARLWPNVFDEVIEYRRFLRDQFGIPVRAEIKANYLLYNRGPFLSRHPLSEGARHRVYRGFLRLAHKQELKVFGVVVKKRATAQGTCLPADPRSVAWEWLLQRLERFSTKGDHPLLLIHDEGDNAFIRGATRKARRAGTAGSVFGTGSLKRPARLIIDDATPRDSRDSYFVQLADLVAYAAFRYIYAPGKKLGQIVPQTMWTELGHARYKPVSELAGGPDGLVVG